jgi:hypothetical protein
VVVVAGVGAAAGAVVAPVAGGHRVHALVALAAHGELGQGVVLGGAAAGRVLAAAEVAVAAKAPPVEVLGRDQRPVLAVHDLLVLGAPVVAVAAASVRRGRRRAGGGSTALVGVALVPLAVSRRLGALAEIAKQGG